MVKNREIWKFCLICKVFRWNAAERKQRGICWRIIKVTWRLTVNRRLTKINRCYSTPRKWWFCKKSCQDSTERLPNFFKLVAHQEGLILHQFHQTLDWRNYESDHSHKFLNTVIQSNRSELSKIYLSISSESVLLVKKPYLESERSMWSFFHGKSNGISYSSKTKLLLHFNWLANPFARLAD